ncbi:MAG: transmembrane anchor protein [Sphingopyxis sp.]|nr:transmembrane anchor protein [Sphingopyxis sp.]
MYNTNIPPKAELPSTAKLIKSTVIAIVTAGVLLVTVVLPAEYAIDPTGIGKALGVAEMGEIKTQLAAEAEADRASARTAAVEASAAGTVVEAPAAAAAGEETPAGKSDEMRVTLKPGEGAEVKLVMERSARVNYEWTIVGGAVNADMHGDGGGNSVSYAKKRGLSSDKGTLTAAFTGNHGWFWRNRGDSDVTIILKVKGAFSTMKRVA